jgi:type I restriction enzyme S subunit
MITDIIVLLLGNSPYNNISWSFTRLSFYYEKFADGKVVCIDDEIPFEVPCGWEWCRLGSISSIYGGKRIPAGRKLSTSDTGH